MLRPPITPRRLLAGCALLALAGLAGLAIAASRMASFTLTPAEIAARFADASELPRDHIAVVAGRPVHWVDVGDSAWQQVVFVHGSPGSWEAFVDFLADPHLADRAHLAALDRPGFGGSARGEAEPSLAVQAAALAPVLASNRAPEGAILVGHSLGGPIVVRAAVDMPDRIAGLVLVAPSVAPALEHPWWIQRPASWPVFAWLLPVDWRTCNRELLPLKSQLQQLAPLWSRVRIPVIVIQGMADDLVPPGNADYIEDRLPSTLVETLRVPGMNHFVPWTHPELITDAVLRLLAAHEPVTDE